MATIIAPNSIFTKAGSPVIVQVKPGYLNSVYSEYSIYELSSKLPRYNTVLSRVLNMGLSDIPLIQFSKLDNFNYITGLFDGPTIEDLAQDPRVQTIWKDGINISISQYPYASADYTYSSPAPKSKVLYFTSLQEIRHLVGADVANSKGFTGSGIVAVDEDTGGDERNPMLAGRLIKQTAIEGLYTDGSNHGSWTASAIGGRMMIDHTFTNLNPGKPPVVNQGMAPDCTLYEIKALGFIVGTGTDSMLLKGMNMTIDDNADVWNASWGGVETYAKPEDSPFYTPLNVFLQKNIIPVVASGDSGPQEGTTDTPGDMPQVLTVGSINAVSNSNPMFGSAGEVSGFSGRGMTAFGTIKPDTTTYGAIIDGATGPVLDLAYEHIPHEAVAIAGTSMSAPIVSGLAVLMRQAHKQLLNKILTVDEIKTMLSELGENPKNNDVGWGPITWQMYENWLSTQYGVKI